MQRDKVSIVQLVSWKHWQRKLCRARFLAVEPLNVQRTGLGWDGYDATETIAENLKRIYGGVPDIVIAYRPLEHRGFNELNCLKVIQYSKTNPQRFMSEVETAKPTLAVFHHYNDFLEWQRRIKEIGIKAVHIPHVADSEIFKDYGLPKRCDVMVVGALDKKIYPLRNKFKQPCELLNTRGFNCVTWEHPGDKLEDASTCDHLVEFAMAINQVRIVCSCSSIYQYRLSKYAEVPACGTLLAADTPVVEDGDTTGKLDGHLLRFDSDETVLEIADGLEKFLRQKKDHVITQIGLEYAQYYTPQVYCERRMAAIEAI